MRIRRLELANFRTFGHAVFEDIPDTVLLVSPNGRGKSSVLEAIAGAKDLVVPYHQDNYQFTEMWQRRSVPIWPSHLPDPVKIGERKAELRIEVEATGSDCDYLRAANISGNVGAAHFVIEDGRHITVQESDEIIKRLCQFHSPADGVGFVDYIRSVRFYMRKDIGNFSSEMDDSHFRKNLGDFHRQVTDQQKFGGFKSFIISSQLNDFSHQQATGDKLDSLELFRKVFDHFFSPKKFLGFRSSEAAGQGRIVVDSPFGSHDTDALSDGEKEVLHILAYLFRLRRLSNVVLWDTPELHLNAALESRLFDAIRSIAPNNQYWIATHSLEFINAVPLESVFVLRQDGNSAVVERASGEERKARVRIYREMGAQVGLQLVSAVVVFVEGKEANSDKRLLDRVIAPSVPGVNFVAGGSCESILSAGTRANNLLAEACTNGDFFAVVDRDYRSDEEIVDLTGKYKDRLFVWNLHEIENIFLQPNLLFQTLKFLDHLGEAETPDSLESELKQVATGLTEWIAADWVAWEFDRAFQPPSRRIGGDDPKGSLQKYTANLKSKIGEATDGQNVEERFEKKRLLIAQIIEDGSWLVRLPGKQLLRKFLERFPTLRPDDYLRAAASVVRERDIKIDELIRLQNTLLQLPGTMPK
ncbi:MAG TPA: AAA family ATPase [Pirellulales bacterium]|jgi:predicted ATPase|nr:AAA family ATPase [Pirellulales bacterium]